MVLLIAAGILFVWTICNWATCTLFDGEGSMGDIWIAVTYALVPYMRYGERVDENPSPGNKEGGITTLEDKSLGCVQKGGTAPVEDVLAYAQPVAKKGLSLLQAPGNDLVASNALAVSGAQLILFTTGRGTPFGCPVPTVKVSSNTALATKKKNWIDFNAGVLLENVSMETAADELFETVLKIASGEITVKSEALDKHELAIFKDGVTL